MVGFIGEFRRSYLFKIAMCSVISSAHTCTFVLGVTELPISVQFNHNQGLIQRGNIINLVHNLLDDAIIRDVDRRCRLLESIRDKGLWLAILL